MSSYFPDGHFFDEPGHLYPYDLRYDPTDRAHLDLLADGRIRFRVAAQSGMASGFLVKTDGSGEEMTRTVSGGSPEVWEILIDPPAVPFSYTFAFRTADGRPVHLVPAGVTNAVERLDRWYLDPAELAPFEVPGWARGAVIYQIFPDRFHNGDPSLCPEGADRWGEPPHWLRHQGGDLSGIIEKADYLADLGIDAVYLNPIFSSPSTHRYDAVDYYTVDEHLGGNDALRALVDKLHNRGVRLILDASFNHCHPNFFAFADVIAHGADSRYVDWFVVEDHPVRVTLRPPTLIRSGRADDEAYLDYLRRLGTESGMEVLELDDEDGPPVETNYECWYGVPTMPRLNLANPETRRYFLDVATHWITDYQIDGWRMDVARYVDPDFWMDLRSAVKAADPEAYLLAEVMGSATPWLQGDRFDGTMNYTFRELSLDYFATGTSTTAAFVDGFSRMLAAHAAPVNEVNHNLLSSHDTERLLFMAGGDVIKARLAMAFQLLAPGAPGLYYGDEIGMNGGKDESRGGFPWHDGELWDRNLLETVTALTWLRRRHRALRYGDMQFVWQAKDAVAFTRSIDGERLLVIVNRGEAIGPIDIPARSGSPETLWGPARARPGLGAVVINDIGPLTASVVKL